MRIVIDAREFSTSTGRYIERLLHYLQKIDQEHDYIVLLRPSDLAKWHASNRRFQAISCPYKEFTFAEQLGFYFQLKNLKADLVHFPMAQQPILYRGKVVTTMQDLTTLRFRNPTKNRIIFGFKQWVYRWVNRWVARKSKAIITPSQFVKDDVVHFSNINPDKITVTYLAADEFEETPMPINEFVHKKFVMYNGRPQPHKNLHRLIQAFAILHNQYPDLYLMIAGKKDASYKAYEAEVLGAGIESRVLFTDWISDGQLKWAMQHANAYVWPSLSEGFGLPPLEAMLYGTPVISSSASCMPEVLGQAAHYFDPFDTQAIAKAIDDVLSNPKLRKMLVEAGKQQVARYSWQRMATQTLAVYNKVLDV